MKHRLLLAVWLSALAVVFAPRCESQQRPTQIANSTQQQDPSSITPPVGKDRTPTNNYNYENQAPRGDATSQWVLVIVGIVTAGFVGWQARETRHAAQATQRSVGHMERQAATMDGQLTAMEGQLAEIRAASEQTDQLIRHAGEHAGIAQKTLDQSREVAIRQLRAYVNVSSAIIKFIGANGYEAQVCIKNYGRTPAYDVRGWIGTWIDKYPLPSDRLIEPSDDFQMSVAILAPDGEPHRWTADNNGVPCGVPPEFISVLGTPEATIYVWGQVQYRDVFGNTWHTKYRQLYGGPGRPRTKPIDGFRCGLVVPDVEGNTAT